MQWVGDMRPHNGSSLWASSWSSAFAPSSCPSFKLFPFAYLSAEKIIVKNDDKTLDCCVAHDEHATCAGASKQLKGCRGVVCMTCSAASGHFYHAHAEFFNFRVAHHNRKLHMLQAAKKETQNGNQWFILEPVNRVFWRSLFPVPERLSEEAEP